MLLLQTLLCLTVFQGILSQYCDITSANKCWSPMTATLGDLIPGPTPSSIPPAVKVYSVCSGLNNVFACMENKMAACSPDDRLLYDTATSSAMFLCTKGKQGYIDHAKCLFSKSSHQAMNTCTSDAITLIKTLIFSVNDLADLKVMSKELCGLASTVRSCLFDTAQENCGRPAASYLQQYMDATIEPFSKFLSCPPPKSDTKYLPLEGKVSFENGMVNPFDTNTISPEALTPSKIQVDRVPSTTPGSPPLSDQTDGLSVVPTCNRYCFLYQHNLPTSIKQGYDDWCEVNCRQGFCPPTSCTCNCNPTPRRLVCEAMDLRFGQSSVGSQWCTSVCQQGFCPKHYCRCRVVLE